MKSILNLVAVCAVVALVGCSSTKSNSASPGAVSECGANCSSACCDKAKSGTSMGAVGEKSNCAATCTKTCPATGATVAPGAVSEKTECTKSQSSCTKTETVSPGAVSEKKSGCCASKSTQIDG